MPKPKEKILVIKLGALGDFIQALGPMAAIRNHHKNAHITVLTTGPFEGFAKSCGYFDEIWLDEKPNLFNFKGWMGLAKRLNDAGFERVYDLQNNDRTNFYFQLFKTRPEWVGIARGASHRNTSKTRTAGHAFDGHVETLALAGIQNIKTDPLKWMEADISDFALKNPYVLLVPGCAPQHPKKRWPAENYAKLGRALQELGYQPVIIGGKSEKSIAHTILESCPAALDLTTKTSLEHIAVLARSAAGAIGNDTGPMHLIGATGCPSIVLFSGQSNPIKHAPKGGNVNVLQKDDLATLELHDVLDHFTPRTKPTKKQNTTVH